MIIPDSASVRCRVQNCISESLIWFVVSPPRNFYFQRKLFKNHFAPNKLIKANMMQGISEGERNKDDNEKMVQGDRR